MKIIPDMRMNDSSEPILLVSHSLFMKIKSDDTMDEYPQLHGWKLLAKEKEHTDMWRDKYRKLAMLLAEGVDIFISFEDKNEHDHDWMQRVKEALSE